MGNGGLNETVNDERFQKESDKKQNYNQQIKQIQARFLNFANSTKWIFYIPIGYIFSHTTQSGQNLQVPINCRSVTFPSFKIGTTKTGFMGYDIDVSTRQNLTDKSLTIKYLVNENWFQYMMLLRWFELEDFTYYNRLSNNTIEKEKQYNKYGDPSNKSLITPDNTGFRSDYELGEDLYGSPQGPMVPCYLYALDNFNNRIAYFLFQNCWLTDVATIDLGYNKTNGTEIESSFQLKFSKYSIHFDSEYLKKMFQTDGISQELL